MGGPALEREKAFILAAMSGFICGGPALEAMGAPPGGRRAASKVPRGVEEAVMLDMLEGTLMSELPREACMRNKGGLLRGEAPVASGEVGGEGLSRGLVGSSLESAMATERRASRPSDSGV